jgi:hypothetical protein
MPDVNLAPWDAQQQAIARRRQLAQALIEQSMSPVEMPTTPGAAVSWTNGLAKIVQALVGNIQNRRLDKEQAALNDKVQASRDSNMLGLMNALVEPAQGKTAMLPPGAPAEGFAFPGDNNLPPSQTPMSAQSVQLPTTMQQEDARTRLVKSLAELNASPDPSMQQYGRLALGDVLGQQKEGRDVQAEIARLLTEQNWRTGERVGAQEFEHGENQANRALKQTEMNRPIPYGGNTPGDVYGTIDPASGLRTIQGTVAARPQGPVTPAVTYNNGIPVTVKKGEQEWPIGDPSMPPDAKAVAAAAVASHKQRLQEQSDIAEAAARRQDARTEATAARQAARDAELAKIRNSSAPEAIKTQVSSAYTTKDMLDTVRGLIAAKPYLLGPAAGRMEQAAQGIGTTFGMQNPADEKDAATLAGHLAYLFANELRAAFPGRPNKEVIGELKKASGQIQQNPGMLEGFLKSAENNANIAIQNGQRWGINLGPTPASPAAGGFSVNVGGKTYTFRDQQSLNNFKRDAGIQ